MRSFCARGLVDPNVTPASTASKYYATLEPRHDKLLKRGTTHHHLISPGSRAVKRSTQWTLEGDGTTISLASWLESVKALLPVPSRQGCPALCMSLRSVTASSRPADIMQIHAGRPRLI